MTPKKIKQKIVKTKLEQSRIGIKKEAEPGGIDKASWCRKIERQYWSKIA